MEQTANNATKFVYQQIRQQILEGQFPLNKKINQNKLAEELKVSRTPVIKALHMLEADGLVENIPQHGFFVHAFTLTEIIELFMLRQSFEMTAAAYLAEYGTREQFDELEQIFAPFQGQEDIDPQAYLRADRAFHCRMFELCNNSLMHRIDQSLQIFQRSFMVGLLRPPRDTMQEHLQIIQALRSREPVHAQEMAQAHTEYTKHRLIGAKRMIEALGLNPDTISVSDALHHI